MGLGEVRMLYLLNLMEWRVLLRLVIGCKSLRVCSGVVMV